MCTVSYVYASRGSLGPKYKYILSIFWNPEGQHLKMTIHENRFLFKTGFQTNQSKTEF